MQSFPPQWNTPPSASRSSGTNVWLIVFGVMAGLAVMCCGGGALLFWRTGASDIVACTNFTVSGEYKKAIPACRSAAKRLPKSGDVHNNLGWCLTLDGQVQEGLSEARKAVELEPTTNSYDTLAMALALSGQSKEALQIETDHVMINGDVTDDSQRITLGMVYYAVGRKEEAHKQWDNARTGSNLQAHKLANIFEAKYP